MRYTHAYPSPIGPIWISEEDGSITGLRFQSVTETEILETPLIRCAAQQLYEYFEGSRQTFDLPLHFSGTLFQNDVWKALLNIPYGQQRSYGAIAAAVGNAKAARAVGMANNKNPIAIIIPCHRVIGSSGCLIGYAGGLDKKRALLELELKNK